MLFFPIHLMGCIDGKSSVACSVTLCVRELRFLKRHYLLLKDGFGMTFSPGSCAMEPRCSEHGTVGHVLMYL